MWLALDDGTLRVKLSQWQKLLAFHFSSLEIPLAHIERVSTERVKTHWSERRVPGGFIPWLLKAGTYRRAGRKDFWCVTGGQPVLRLDLQNEYFNSLTLGMKDNEHWVKEITGQLPSSPT
jgi:hypothetical protein